MKNTFFDYPAQSYFCKNLPDGTIKEIQRTLLAGFPGLNGSIDLGHWGTLGVAYSYSAFPDYSLCKGNGYHVSFTSNPYDITN